MIFYSVEAETQGLYLEERRRSEDLKFISPSLPRVKVVPREITVKTKDEECCT